MIKLSIIIPAYNAEPYIDELINSLKPQITDEVEVLVIDDGSRQPYLAPYDFVQVFRKENGGCSTARNLGLDKAVGEYVSFIDADDMIPHYFIQTLLEKIKGGYDVIDFSWRSLSKEGAQHDHRLMNDSEWLTNPSVCTRAFKRSFIGDTRFNEQKDSTEDEDFSRKVGFIFKDAGFKHGAISEYMYFYRTAVDNSKIKRFKKGLMKTKRIVYHVPYVAADRMDLLEEIRREDQKNEVWLLTQQCDIPEMRRYCQIHKPFAIWGHELRGEPLNEFKLIKAPIRAQVILYCEFANRVGGITTFLYSFCKEMAASYDILVLYEKIDSEQVERLARYVRVMQYTDKLQFACDTLILNRLTDQIKNVYYKKSVQICHCCRQNVLQIPKDRDILVNVSQASKDSWGADAASGIVIHNMVHRESRKALILISATRVGARDKGKNDSRMIKLARMLENSDIPYVWLNFSDKQLSGAPEHFINMPATLDIQSYIAKATYLVQLSDEGEAYPYSVLEALINNVPVIVTPFRSAIEQGVKDGESGYIVPYDMNFDVKKLLDVPVFLYAHSNEPMKNQWAEILGNPHCRENYQSQNAVFIEALKTYKDLELGRKVERGEKFYVREERASDLIRKGLCTAV